MPCSAPTCSCHTCCLLSLLLVPCCVMLCCRHAELSAQLSHLQNQSRLELAAARSEAQQLQVRSCRQPARVHSAVFSTKASDLFKKMHTVEMYADFCFHLEFCGLTAVRRTSQPTLRDCTPHCVTHPTLCDCW